jgi:tight adherence protein B
VHRSTGRVRDLAGLLDANDTELAPGSPEARAALAAGGRLAERALHGTGVLARLRTTIDRSDWKLSAGEVVAVSAGLAVLGGVVGGLIGGPVAAVIAAVALLVAPYVLVERAVRLRMVRFDEQLPDVLDVLAASLESGSSVAQALELVVAEVEEPSATEFARVLAATRLGAPLEVALHAAAERLGSRDLAYTVQAVAMQQRTGGQLADVLRIVADFMRKRLEVRREVRALTAEGRLSGLILGGLPFVLAGIISVENPGYLDPLFTTGTGVLMVGGASVLMVLAFILTARIVRVEV